MTIELTELPFATDALEPFMSQETVFFHYQKHHRGYVDKLNEHLKDNCVDQNNSLEAIVLSAQGKIFNFAAQVWNHNFFWLGLSAEKQGPKDPALRKLIEKSFGEEEEFRQQFKKIAAGQFGSGWAWLVYDTKRELLELTSTSNAETPLTGSRIPLLTLDVWEHAYYIDYRDNRAHFIDVFLKNLVNWSFVAKNLHYAMQLHPKKRAYV